MSRAVVFEIEVPDTLEQLRLPAGVDERLTHLLDAQDENGALTSEERREAEGLADLAELLSLLRVRAERLSSPSTEGPKRSQPDSTRSSSSARRPAVSNAVSHRWARRGHSTLTTSLSKSAAASPTRATWRALVPVARFARSTPACRRSVIGENATLFNPRDELWPDHFHWQGFDVVGVSPTGRATVEALGINALMVALREEESVLCRHPPGSWATTRFCPLVDTRQCQLAATGSRRDRRWRWRLPGVAFR